MRISETEMNTKTIVIGRTEFLGMILRHIQYKGVKIHENAADEVTFNFSDSSQASASELKHVVASFKVASIVRDEESI